jgi:hypothetical protein
MDVFSNGNISLAIDGRAGRAIRSIYDVIY